MGPPAGGAGSNPQGESARTPTPSFENQTTYNIVTILYVYNDNEQRTMPTNKKDNNAKTTFSHCNNDKTKS